MLKASICISNPFAKDTEKQWSYCKAGSLTRNKSFELVFYRGSIYDLALFELDFSIRGKDHAGVGLTASILCFEFSIKVYDNRHWDYKRGTWQSYQNESELS